MLKPLIVWSNKFQQIRMTQQGCQVARFFEWKFEKNNFLFLPDYVELMYVINVMKL